MILRRAAEVNKVLLPEKLFDEETQYTPSTVRIWSLFSSKALLTRTLIDLDFAIKQLNIT